MKNTTTTTTHDTPTTPTTARPDFDDLKTAFTVAYLTDPASNDTAAALYALSTATAAAVVKKCLDPQRKTAPTRDTVSNNGFTPALVALRREVYADTAAAAVVAGHLATDLYTTTDTQGDTVYTPAALEMYPALCATFGDGLDLVNAAAVAILEYAQKTDPDIMRDRGGAWLDRPFTARRLSRKVYADRHATPVYSEYESSPIREVFRAVRREIMQSKATATDPRNGYSYIEDITPDGMDTIYYRLGKYADLGGVDCNGQYTADNATADRYTALVDSLHLTARQTAALALRTRGYGYKAIANSLGIRPDSVRDIFKGIQKKALAAGLTPDRHADPDTATA